jgi:putative hydrolase of the HAD superfamily
MSHYKNIVFDIGNVLVHYDPEAFIQRSPYRKEKEALMREIFDSWEWVELDRGTIDEREAFDRFLKRNPSLREEIMYIEEHWVNEVFTLIGGTSEILTRVKKQGYRVYLLSNFGKRGFEKIEKEYPFFMHIDGKIVSYTVKSVKPEKEIYEHLLNRYHLNPEETVFIDDNENNLETASKYGILCHRFQNPDVLSEFLETAGIGEFGGEKGSTGIEE